MKRVIIVEDETMVRDLMVEVLDSYPQCKRWASSPTRRPPNHTLELNQGLRGCPCHSPVASRGCDYDIRAGRNPGAWVRA